jgi:putative transposase
MQLVEKHVIDRRDPQWAAIDSASFLSKNLYNAANYLLRQEYIFNHRYIPYSDLAKLMRTNPDYCALPRKVSQWVLQQVDHDWQSFFAAFAEWQIHPDKFTGRPCLPKYKHKTNGRNLLTYTVQAVGKRAFKQKGVIKPSQLGISIWTKQKNFDQVRIIPHKTYYAVEVVYTAQVQIADVDCNRIASIDIGLDTLAAVTSNQPEFTPLLVNGRPLKAINQGYNKERARLLSLLLDKRHSSNRLEILTNKRNRRIDAYLHLASRRLINLLVQHQIGTLVIGKNNGWKTSINLGGRTNQNFVQIPHARFIKMLTYKAQLVGIQVIITDESYTSKCSFLDFERISKHKIYAGKRAKRWLFIASDGRQIHADVNASYNILRKVFPTAFAARGIAASVARPIRITPY